jgi:hypothetical protein
VTQRIKSDDCRLNFTGPSGAEEAFGNIQSFELELDLEILRERYVGETADRFDELFKGVNGRAELHLSTKQYFQFTQRVQDRAQRRTAASGKFTATASYTFADGTRARIVVDDIFWGKLPLKTPGGGGYVTASVEFGASGLKRLL